MALGSVSCNSLTRGKGRRRGRGVGECQGRGAEVVCVSVQRVALPVAGSVLEAVVGAGSHVCRGGSGIDVR